MKHYLTSATAALLLAILPTAAATPSEYLESASVDSLKTRVDLLLEKSTRNYNFHSTAHTTSKPVKTLLRYKGASESKPDSIKLIVKVKCTMVGANRDLEIEGSPLYEIEEAWGSLPDIMPFWNLIDPSSAEEISRKGGVYTDLIDHRGAKRTYRMKRDTNSTGGTTMWFFTRTW